MNGIWHSLLIRLPFEWAQYAFMRNALMAIILIAPICGVLGTLIVNNRMAFFADSIGHGALAGLAAGVIFGCSDPSISLILFAALFAIALVMLRKITSASTDTIIATVTATTVAGGIVILSRGGGFSKFTRYLIGDILSISPKEIYILAVVLIATVTIWLVFFNKFLLSALNVSIAKTRGINPFLMELLFSIIVALVIAVAIPWVGLFIISSLLVLPATAARNICNRVYSYHIFSVTFAILSGIIGLQLSYSWNTATGATIVLVSAAFFFITLFFRKK